MNTICGMGYISGITGGYGLAQLAGITGPCHCKQESIEKVGPNYYYKRAVSLDMVHLEVSQVFTYL